MPERKSDIAPAALPVIVSPHSYTISQVSHQERPQRRARVACPLLIPHTWDAHRTPRATWLNNTTEQSRVGANTVCSVLFVPCGGEKLRWRATQHREAGVSRMTDPCLRCRRRRRGQNAAVRNAGTRNRTSDQRGQPSGACSRTDSRRNRRRPPRSVVRQDHPPLPVASVPRSWLGLLIHGVRLGFAPFTARCAFPITHCLFLAALEHS